MTRITTRIDGENVSVHDTVVVSFSTKETVAQVGLVGQVKRIRLYDEGTGAMLEEPELWFQDERSEHLVGPIRLCEIDRIAPIDGRWCTDQEVSTLQGEPYESGIDNGHVAA